MSQCGLRSSAADRTLAGGDRQFYGRLAMCRFPNSNQRSSVLPQILQPKPTFRHRLWRMFAPRSLATGLIVSSLTAAAITAQSSALADEKTAPEAKKPIPPKVKTFVEPTYPPAKLAAGEKAEVVLLVTIATTGKVTDAKIQKSAGPDFDAAALEAATKLEFEPATLDGKPIVAKIPFRYSFDFKEVPKVDDPTKPTDPKEVPKPVVVLSGLVKTPADEPLPGAEVIVTGADGKILKLTTDETGTFAASDLPAGRYLVVVKAVGFKPYDSTEDVVAGKRTEVIYRPKVAGDSIEIEVKGDRPAREVTVRKLDRRELTRIPGTNGDALRAILNLPGVARPPGLAGLLIIRGSAPNDTNVFVDGTLIPIAFHFGGLSSVIPSELLDKIDFYPGNFSPEYGRVMGGIVDIGLRSPNKEKVKGLIQLDLIDFRLVAEGPIDSKTRFAVGGRRSWVDVWLGPVLKATGAGVSTAPRYYDYQLMIERDITAATTARLAFFGSDDKLGITVDTPSASDPALGGNLGLSTRYWRIQGRTETKVSEDIKWINTVAFGRDAVTFGLGDFAFRLDTYPTTWRSDVRGKIAKDVTGIVGLDWLWTQYDVFVRAPPAPRPGEAPGPFFARPIREVSGSGTLYRPGIYALLDLSPIKGLKILPGVRIDYTKDTLAWNVSPRFAFRYDVHREYPRTTIKGGVGLYMQPPQPQQSLVPFGTAGIDNNRSTHYGFGIEQEFTKNIELSAEGFYKQLESLVSQRASENLTSSGNTYENKGSGRVYGAEILLRYKADDRFFGWLAYTLSRSERRGGPDEPYRLFQFDQTHILTVLGSYKLGRGWEVGARFRYVSGSMYTPNVGGLVDFDAGAYSPISSFPLFGSRLPSFNQLDFRVDKTWTFQHWKLGVYLDVQNVYNRANVEAINYNYNYSQSSVTSGLPILPVLGIRGEL